VDGRQGGLSNAWVHLYLLTSDEGEESEDGSNILLLKVGVGWEKASHKEWWGGGGKKVKYNDEDAATRGKSIEKKN